MQSPINILENKASQISAVPLGFAHGIVDPGWDFAESLLASQPNTNADRVALHQHSRLCHNHSRALLFPSGSPERLYAVGPYKTTTARLQGASSPPSKGRSMAVPDRRRGLNKLVARGSLLLGSDHGCGVTVTTAENGSRSPLRNLRGVGGLGRVKGLSHCTRTPHGRV
jgi:hypothetical protein